MVKFDWNINVVDHTSVLTPTALFSTFELMPRVYKFSVN